MAGQFYPADKDELSHKVENLLNAANPPLTTGEIFCLISPHAGYDFSGPTAALGYKLIKGRPYKTVVLLGPSHQYYFKGVSVYPSGKFQTPLGDLEVDSDFTQKIISPSQNISFIPQAFEKEHSIEVQLPFLQKTLDDFKIVPILIGDADLHGLNVLADILNKAIAGRSDVLLIASTDLCHSYDYQETERVDKLTLSYLGKMPAPLEAGEQSESGKRLLTGSAQDIYAKLKDGSIQMCGGLPVVSAILTAQSLGYNQIKFLGHTNSAKVSGKKIKGVWTVGYLSALINKDKTGETVMLNDTQKARLLEIARKTIQEYVTSGKKLDFSEDDPQLKAINGAFVTIHKQGKLKGCIGNIIGQKPLFETIRDMAIESATGDPRFEPVTKDELKDIEIEISVLSPLKKIDDVAEFQLGTHGLLIKRGWSQGVFLPQVAEETGWNKEEFLSNLCAHKAGLPADSWKDAKTEKYTFSALVFSEKKQ
ncbi:MAG: AmmeMemoRadiSam system protein B [Candidatus Omnitrophota bacterium]|nr:AmmeMemoRadiSam system protein B [Candidatus Omnitrophota bacterium]